MLPPEADPLVSTYLLAKAAEDVAKAQKQLSENSLKDLMKDAECGQTPQGAKIYWKSITSVRINSSKLKADLPEIAEKYGIETNSRRFAITAPETGEKE
jgi:predicted phage-related endonuclease